MLKITMFEETFDPDTEEWCICDDLTRSFVVKKISIDGHTLIQEMLSCDTYETTLTETRYFHIEEIHE
jgi:hypothetical protein